MTLSKKILAAGLSFLMLSMNAIQIFAASWISPDKDIRSPLEVEDIDVDITNVTKKVSNVCYDLQSENPTSLYQLKADGTTHEAMCVAAKRTSPGNGGQAYKLDLSGLSGLKGNSSHLNEASANLTASDEVYTVWANAFKYSDLYKYNDEQILRKIAWLIEDGKWTYYPLSKKYVASDVYGGITLDFESPITSSNIYRDLTISKDALSRYVAFDIDSDRFGANISGLYGAAHAIASRMISGDRYHLSGTIYYSFTRTASDKATYTYGSHSAFAYGDDGKGNDNNLYRRIQLTQYFNIIAHAPEYEGDLYIYSPDKRSGVGQQWLLYVDHATDIRLKKAYANPQIVKKTASGDAMLGASFDLFSDASMSNKIGTLEDKDNDGIYSDYTNLSKGDDEVSDLLNLELKDDVFIKTFYVHEAKAPVSVKNSAGIVYPLIETITDDNLYKVDLSYLPDNGTLTSVISSDGKKVYSGKLSNYDVTGKGAKVLIANASEGDFVDGTAIAVKKTTQNGYDVTKARFILYGEGGKNSNALAYYRYDGEWSWFDEENGGNKIGKYYPLKLDSSYILYESYECDTYKDTDVTYQVINTSEWMKTGDNEYSKEIRTSGISIGDVLSIEVNNDRVTCSVKISKSADDGVIEGRKFDVYYLGNESEASAQEVLMGSYKTDSKGIVTVSDLPLGWYKIEEKDHEGYSLEWQGITRTVDGNAVIRITEADTVKNVGATNKVMVNVAVIKKDSWTKEALSGASFRLYQDVNMDGDLSDDELEKFLEADSDSNGIALFKNIGLGEYFITESAAPAGYYVCQQAYKISVKGFTDTTISVDGNEIKAYIVEVLDEPYQVPLYIYKRDSSDHDLLLKGAAFSVYSDINNNCKYDSDVDEKAKTVVDGKSYEVVIREQNGRYEAVYEVGNEYKTAMLRFGTYFVVEDVAPEMYRGLDEAVMVTVTKPSGETPETPDPVVLYVDNELGFRTVLTGIGDSKVPELSETASLIDTVSYTNLIVGKEYAVKGELVLLNEDGSYASTGIVAETSFVPEGALRSDGTIEVKFNFDSTLYMGKSLVAFERLYDNEGLIAVHEDPDDIDQTVSFPDIGTELVDKVTQTHIASFAEETVLVDMVAFRNLIPGKEYELTGTLYDKDSGEELKDAEGNTITSTKSFVPDSSEGVEEIEFTIDTTIIQQKMIVAFETLLYERRTIAIHADIDDESQTVGIADIYTTATDEQGDKNVDVDHTVNIIDHVEYENLTPGKQYVVRGILMYSGTDEVYYDPDNNAVTAQVRFTPEAANGTVDVSFNFDGSNLSEGQRLVVYEDAYIVPDDPDKKEILICVHKDPNNENQTVRFVADVPQTGDRRNDSNYIEGMIASVGVIISSAGMMVMMKRKLFDYE